ncbi:dinitrogenase iron-molybdenum cofactor biosynthesis protein [Varunaivibrio sulfuroxidans]|uniref:Nitrogen fixation protein NifX n=1 Tax=Varunaivibrio sulfuroxidans TaxID=1773489 RepID=A0A4R3J9Q3_9PROT|nr:dinitrogenase iron-molybdenum cofactor biosynthesis protein [Varunaivibrio sulfuroxidans]TCS61746.1 nitrogen fixation protein NifX [Varunaivibrio sulfuroxidans]WES32070.1 dinitrogenase iron-molybdenum cofactor biosynthesis protein [Varunaivibrio sulfuroxidans]
MANSATPQISRNMALRIGLAARAVPDLKPAQMLAVLEDAVGLPPRQAKLKKLGIDRLRTASGGVLSGAGRDALKAALSILKGETELPEDAVKPEVQAYRDGDMPGSLRVACASNGREDLDGHFGSCLHFLIYQVSGDELRLIAVRPCDPSEREGDKNAYRASLIADCQLVYVASIGGPAAAKVVRAGVHPIKFPLGGNAPDILRDLQGVIATAPPPWLAKAMGRAPEFHIETEVGA